MLEVMRIGELAEQAGVSPKAVRYYEDIGLIPAPPRTASHYRDYGSDTISRLGFIRAAQSVGLTLGEIREILAFREQGETPCQHVAALIKRHAEDLSERIATLEGMRRDLERLARKAKTASRSKDQGAEFCHIIETGLRER